MRDWMIMGLKLVSATKCGQWTVVSASKNTPFRKKMESSAMRAFVSMFNSSPSSSNSAGCKSSCSMNPPPPTLHLAMQEWCFGSSRSSKVIDFGTNQKRVCDFLLVRHGNLGPILHRFRDTGIADFFVLLTPPLFHPNFGVFTWQQIAHVGVSNEHRAVSYSAVKLFSKYSNMTCVKNIPQRHSWRSVPYMFQDRTSLASS